MTVFYLARPNGVPKTSVARTGDDPTRAGATSAIGGSSALPAGLRVGFTVGRVLGGSVQRNRMKRRLREAVRMALPRTNVAADVVINPKKSLLSADFSAVRNEVSRAFEVIEQKVAGKPVDKLASESAVRNIARTREPEAGRRS